jgi:DNA-binding FadR family transcriptional regulator
MILVQGLQLPRVAAAIDASRANIDRVRRLLSSPRRHAVTLAEHREIFRALEARDAQAARRAVDAHLEAVMEELGRFSVEHAEVFVHV